ncbi:hypothetical protein [Heyndrickxia ginsengihumi]
MSYKYGTTNHSHKRSSGIGESTAKVLANNNAKVVLAAGVKSV